MIDLRNCDCMELLKNLPDASVDIILTDPPYALGSTVIIRPDGKPDYSKAVDFMAKWTQPDGAFWEAWFIEAIRVLKRGGRVVMFGMDRQLMLNSYYACFAGFQQTQSLYWYFISNFPKASDLSKMLDKNAGAEREVVGDKVCADGGLAKDRLGSKNYQGNGYGVFENDIDKSTKITSPNTDLAKKYAGYKYSVSPLKQTCETIMVFQKPYKTGSCLRDTLAMEAGDNSITCGAMNIEGTKVGTENTQRTGSKQAGVFVHKTTPEFVGGGENGRYPSQTFCDSEAGEALDRQSGVTDRSDQRLEKLAGVKTGKDTLYQSGLKPITSTNYTDIGGCSKILHKCDYEQVDFDLYLYCAKVSQAERNKGMRGSEKKDKPPMATDAWSLENMNFNAKPSANFHPTVKPISLITRILQLFRTPNQQTILDCFMGSGSIGVACKQEGFAFIGCELDTDYFTIAQKRISKAKFTKQTKLI